MIPGNAEVFDRPWLLLCEGLSDQRFFYRLLEMRGIENQFSIRYPQSKDGKWGGGRDSFGRDLNAVMVNEDFIQNVYAILIVSDKDDDAEGSFRKVQTEIGKVKGLPIPPSERTVARGTRGSPHVVVLMLPMTGNGNLETLCLTAAHEQWGLKEELDQFVAACPANEWSFGKQSKMRMQTMLAATNANQPDTGFTGHWNQPAQYQIRLSSNCFDEVAIFLQQFGELVGGREN